MPAFPFPFSLLRVCECVGRSLAGLLHSPTRRPPPAPPESEGAEQVAGGRGGAAAGKRGSQEPELAGGVEIAPQPAVRDSVRCPI